MTYGLNVKTWKFQRFVFVFVILGLLHISELGPSLAVADEVFTVEHDGELIDVSSSNIHCLPPEARNGIVRINCSMFDGPVYFFDELTKDNISICTFWGCGLLRDDEEREACKTKCPPKRWPIEIPDCDSQVVEGIEGTWRHDLNVSPGGLSPVRRGSSMTFTTDSVIFNYYEIVKIKRSYSIVESENRQYILELKDQQGESERLNIKLMPCGLEVKSKDGCSAFCQNVRDDISEEDFREIVIKVLSGGSDDSLIEAVLQQPAEVWRQQSIFPKHSFFREVITD